jgi:hypothetical protein
MDSWIIHVPSGSGSIPWYLVNPKIAGKWMFIPLKMYFCWDIMGIEIPLD